ncbi:MAG: hypothetical protein K2L14_05420 [Duncaniella sp.]|nr:hypothetical protein [Duncaniella sp.]
MNKSLFLFILCLSSMIFPLDTAAKNQMATAYPAKDIDFKIAEKIKEVADSIRQLTSPRYFENRGLNKPVIVAINYYEDPKTKERLSDAVKLIVMDETEFADSHWGIINWPANDVKNFGYTEIDNVAVILVDVKSGISFFNTDRNALQKQYKLYSYPVSQGVPIHDGLFNFIYKVTKSGLEIIREQYPKK